MSYLDIEAFSKEEPQELLCAIESAIYNWFNSSDDIADEMVNPETGLIHVRCLTDCELCGGSDRFHNLNELNPSFYIEPLLDFSEDGYNYFKVDVGMRQ